MELASKYNPTDIEQKWYDYWERHGFFHSHPDGREPYTMVIPPPNVTGVLHMGHMLNNTIQDVLVRRARMMGKNACWVPGTDHASIATEAKVVSKLAEQGIKKSDLSREEFLRHAWAWTEEHGGIILQQLRRLGASCDWRRTAFTMDEVRSESVTRVFCDLYHKGFIYRGVRMVNWDPKALTALSDEEVVYREEQSKLYYLKYRVAGASADEYAVVATTRPETIMGDTAMCIHPDDKKNAWLKGKKVIVPLVGRVIPVIEDEYVEIGFGTGCLKVTPAHDVNDYMLGEKHHLESIDIFNDDGTLSPAAGLYVGMDRFQVRKQIVKDLDAAGLLERTEDYTNKVGYSERTHVPIEPKLSMQWFLSMQHFARLALPPVMDDRLMFHPSKYKNIYRHWMENIKDWCISRQLWWGHRIPAWYPEGTLPDSLPEGALPKWIVAESEDKAWQWLHEHYPSLLRDTDRGNPPFTLRQDDDCLDTWFSSWLWPLSLFDGILRPDNEQMKYYYPTADLVTGPDIIFFWVARMIMAGYQYAGEMPFRHVYFTGIVRDKLGRKMSKSLGNSPDPLELIDQYGADGVRMGLLLSAPAGNDLLFDHALCEQGRNFNNKIWNAFRLVKSWQPAPVEQPDAARRAGLWFQAQLDKTLSEIDDLFGKYRLSEALMQLYRLFWDEFSAWYLEMVKPTYGQAIDELTYRTTLGFFDAQLRALHPFMPFITEELWQALEQRAEGESITVAPMPRPGHTDQELIETFGHTKEIIAGIRTVRLQKNIAHKTPLTLHTGAGHNAAFDAVIRKMGNIESIEPATGKASGVVSFLVGTTEYAVPIGKLLDVEQEKKKLQADLAYYEGFLASVMKKLSNEKFVTHAKPSVVEAERKKKADAESKIAALKEGIAALQ